jgi:glucose/arabinose dehydrogenase
MRPAFLLVAFAAAASGCNSSSSDARQPTTVAADSSAAGTSAGTAAAATAAPVETRLTVPAGLQATRFAIVTGARAMTVGPDGAVYVSQPASNQITRLVVGAGGAAAPATVAVKGLNKPHGMAFHNGWFYIANTDGVVRVKLDSSGVATGTPEKLNHYGTGGGHWTRSIVFGPDNKMYVSIGSSCNLCVEKDSTRATVMQFDENGKNGRIFARGLRNAVGIAFNPATQELWASQNERDDIKPEHENLPPEELNILRDGGDYGWPYCYGNRIPNPEYDNAARCAKTIAPALEMQAHSAPLSLTFLNNATQLAPGDRGDALIAFHGSWNRTTPTGAKVVRIRIQDNKPVGAEDFVTGWQTPDGKRWGRPVDVAVLNDGSMLITEDTEGEIVRISRK